jgi:hypothetical protein
MIRLRTNQLLWDKREAAIARMEAADRERTRLIQEIARMAGVDVNKRPEKE